MRDALHGAEYNVRVRLTCTGWAVGSDIDPRCAKRHQLWEVLMLA
jgi:hypothetical protein